MCFHLHLQGAAVCYVSQSSRLQWLFGQRPQRHALISPLAVLSVEVVLVDIFYHRVWYQVFHAQSASQSPSDLCGARLIPHPFSHLKNVLPVA